MFGLPQSPVTCYHYLLPVTLPADPPPPLPSGGSAQSASTRAEVPACGRRRGDRRGRGGPDAGSRREGDGGRRAAGSGWRPAGRHHRYEDGGEHALRGGTR